MTAAICPKTLNALRAARGWSYDDLARESGVSRRSLIRYEKPENWQRRNGAQAERIAKAFGLEVHELATTASHIVIAEGDFVPIRTEMLELYERSGRTEVRLVLNPSSEPQPGYRYLTLLGSAPGTIVIRKPPTSGTL